MAERQSGKTLEQIRRDHVVRYEYARDWLAAAGRTRRVLDAGCGVGYGASILADVAREVIAIDRAAEARALWEAHYRRANVRFERRDLERDLPSGPFDAIVCFECLEHLERAAHVVERFGELTDTLVASVPNEDVRPHDPAVNPFHVRHYRPAELASLLARGGFEIVERHCQRSGAEPDLLPGTDGKFLVVVASRPPRA